MAPASHSNGVDVSARFWWWDSDYATHIARPVRVPRWEEIGRNYSAATARRLEQLVGWRGGPPTGGRLIICHGPSGTGKTHAVQMLAGAWRDWADLHVISDPEQFLSNPAYLMSVASAHGEGDGGRWRVAVLEDAGEQLAFDGRGSQQAVGRLLNVGDGVLGQALRMLVLITTNEPLDRLDARVRRPGRQLAEVPFAPLNRDEIGRWCADRPLEPPDRGSVTLADLYALAAGAELSAPPRPVGFSPAGG
jgi:hypothetical protein